jgi:hypothetical protein
MIGETAMMIQGVSIPEMVNQSITVMTKPGVATFEQFEKRGGQREGLVYVATAAAIGAAVSLLVGIFTLGFLGGIITAIFTAILPVASYFLFSTLVYMIGSNQGGTGSRDEVFYSLSLFVAPIQAINGVIGSIPILGCLAAPATLALGIYQIYLGYLSTRSSMNLDQNKAIITMVLAWIAQVIVTFIILAVMGALLAAVGAVTPTAFPTTP